MNERPVTEENNLPADKHTESLKPAPETFRQVIYNLLLISIGSSLVAVAINGILIPHKFVSGGLVGLALVFINLKYLNSVYLGQH